MKLAWVVYRCRLRIGANPNNVKASTVADTEWQDAAVTFFAPDRHEFPSTPGLVLVLSPPELEHAGLPNGKAPAESSDERPVGSSKPLVLGDK